MVSREEIREYQRRYRQRPENKERARQYRQRPDVKEKRRDYARRYQERPDVKEKNRQYSQRPEIKERARQYRQRPENKERARRYRQWYIQQSSVKEKINRKRREKYVATKKRISPEVQQKLSGYCAGYRERLSAIIRKHDVTVEEARAVIQLRCVLCKKNVSELEAIEKRMREEEADDPVFTELVLDGILDRKKMREPKGVM